MHEPALESPCTFGAGTAHASIAGAAGIKGCGQFAGFGKPVAEVTKALYCRQPLCRSSFRGRGVRPLGLGVAEPAPVTEYFGCQRLNVGLSARLAANPGTFVNLNHGGCSSF